MGKEASNLERTGILDNLDYIMYQTKETFKKEAVEKGLEWALENSVPRATFYRWKQHTQSF